MHVRSDSGYFGEPLRSLGGEGFRVSVSRYTAGTRLGAHEHEHGHFCLVLEGSYRERVGARSFQRGAMDLVWYPAGAAHAEEHRTEGRHLLVDVASTARAHVDGVAALRDPAALHVALELARSLLRPRRDGELDGPALVAELCAFVACRDGARRPPPWLARVEEELRARFREEVRLSELAATAGVSAPHLARTWRRHRGRSLGESLRALRVAHAARRLRAGSERLADIALDAGFADQSHMGRVFLRMLGRSPARFRAERL